MKLGYLQEYIYDSVLTALLSPKVVLYLIYVLHLYIRYKCIN